jgi:DNA-binding XRE family transcriptional regulator
MARSFDDLAKKAEQTWDGDAQAVYEAATAYYAAQAHAQLTLGEQLAALRAENGLTQKELAAATGVPQPEISRIERGNGNPTRDTLTRLAIALGARLTLAPEHAPASREARAR